MSRGRRAAWGFGASLVSAAVTAVVGFVSAPVLLHYLGAERVGAFRAATDLLGYLSLLDLGMGVALAGVLAGGVSRGDADEVRAGLAAGVRFYTRLAAAACGLAAVLAVAAPYLFRGSAGTLAELRVGLLLALPALAVVALTPLRSLADARQRGYAVQLAFTAGTLVGFGASVGLAAAGWGIPGQFAAYSAGIVTAVLLVAADELRRHPDGWAAVAGRVPVPADTAARLRGLNRSGFVLAAAARFALQSDALIINFVLGPAAVMPFVLTQRLIQLATAQTLALGSATWAGLAELYHRGETAVFHRRVADVARYTVVIAAAGVLPAAVWGRSFVRLWVGEEFYAGDLVTALTAAAAVLQALAALFGWLFAGTGKPGRLVRWAVANAGLNVSLSVTATYFVGLPGPLLGTAAAHLLVGSWWFPRALRREFGLPPGLLGKAVVGPLLAAAVYGGVLAVVAETVAVTDLLPGRVGGLVMLGGTFGTAAVGYLLLCWAAVLTPDERADWRDRLRRARGR